MLPLQPLDAGRARIIGPGRAGLSLAGALESIGWTVAPLLDRRDDPAGAAQDVDLLVVATPDDAVARVAAQVDPVPSTVVAHLSGALGTGALATHPRRGCLHPLVGLPDARTGSERLRSGVTFVVAGDPVVGGLVAALGGRAVEVPDTARGRYHAAASVAANHVVATLAQVSRLAEGSGLALADFLPLVRAAVEDVARVGPRAALTGAVARGDWATVTRHLESMPPEERAGYLGGVALVLGLLDEPPPPPG